MAASPDSFVLVHGSTIISSSVRYNVPAIFSGIGFVWEGGLISYATDFTDVFRRAAGYADRILRGEKPADLQEVPKTSRARRERRRHTPHRVRSG
jgi:putative ABC transport system substrate-binding protein